MPKRRIAPAGNCSSDFLGRLASAVRYGGSALHKRRPGDYGFHPPANPRANKNLCDGLRPVPREEAEELLARGIAAGMISSTKIGEFPKFVWAVDAKGEAYEAKIGEDGTSYHGYRLGRDESAMREWVLDEWKARCTTG